MIKKNNNNDKEKKKKKRKWNDDKDIEKWNKKYRIEIEIGNREEIERRKKSKSESGGEVGANCTIGTKSCSKSKSFLLWAPLFVENYHHK